MKNLKLETCPFCLSDEIILIEMNFSGTFRFSVKCMSCGSSTANFKEEDKAVVRWNTRERKTTPNLKDFT